MHEELVAPGILISWGGADIHPSFYHRTNVASHVGNSPSKRDQDEAVIMALAIERGVTIFGVCRGAQLACALAGGLLVQDVDGHEHGHHFIETKDGATIMTTSAHHQMLYPWTIPHELIAWSKRPRGTQYLGLTDEEMAEWPTRIYMDDKEGLIEPEIVWLPSIKCLAVQGHPEWMAHNDSFNLYIKGLLDARCPTS